MLLQQSVRARDYRIFGLRKHVNSPYAKPLRESEVSESARMSQQSGGLTISPYQQSGKATLATSGGRVKCVVLIARIEGATGCAASWNDGAELGSFPLLTIAQLILLF